jgi:hypothetical protein
MLFLYGRNYKGIDNDVLEEEQIFLQVVKLKVTIYGKNSKHIIYT